MYRVATDTNLEEEELSHIEGYRHSRPVRIGNGAYTQTQHDVYGEVLSSAHLLASTGQTISEAQWDLLAHWRTWRRPAGSNPIAVSGRCVAAHTTSSTLRSCAGWPWTGPWHWRIRQGTWGPESEEWERTAHAIKREVLQRGGARGSRPLSSTTALKPWTQATLLLPLVGFLPFDDPRVISTVQRIREELGQNPFLPALPHRGDGRWPGGERGSLHVVQLLVGPGAGRHGGKWKRPGRCSRSFWDTPITWDSSQKWLIQVPGLRWVTFPRRSPT